MIRRAALILALILTTLAPSCLVDESDGRYASCGVVTEHGVTEHLDAYAERCGDGRGR